MRYQASARPILDPPGRAAEGLGDLLGAAEAGQGEFAVGAMRKALGGRWGKRGEPSLGEGALSVVLAALLRRYPIPAAARVGRRQGLRLSTQGRRCRSAAGHVRCGTASCW